MEAVDFTQFFVSLAGIIGFIYLFFYLLQRFGLDRRLRGVTGAKGRLQVAEVLYIDPKRKLMIVRADKKEYLLLVAGDTATVIDTVKNGISKGSKAA